MRNSQTKNLLKTKHCRNYNESNKHDAKIRISWWMILSYDSYNETVEKEKEMKNIIASLLDQVIILTEKVEKLEGKVN